MSASSDSWCDPLVEENTNEFTFKKASTEGPFADATRRKIGGTTAVTTLIEDGTVGMNDGVMIPRKK